MRNRFLHPSCTLIWLGISAWLLLSCQAPSREPTKILPLSPTPSTTSSATRNPAELTPSPSPTSPSTPGRVVFLVPPGANLSLVEKLETALSESLSTAGFEWDERTSLAPETLSEDIALVITFPPDPGIETLAKSAPDTQFLAIGIPGVTKSSNLSTIGAAGDKNDQVGFMAGAIAAIVTEDWRVGAVTQTGLPEDQQALQGFLNGVVYFCGLCRQTYPPFYSYPISLELPAGASQAEKQATVQYLVDRYVRTVYVTPAVSDDAFLKALAEAGVNIIGSGTPPEEIRSNWIVSLATDPLGPASELLPRILDGQGGQDLPILLVFAEINPDLFSPGRQTLAFKILDDLTSGYIATGAENTPAQ